MISVIFKRNQKAAMGLGLKIALKISAEVRRVK